MATSGGFWVAAGDFSAVTEVGVDETSSKRGHNYVSVFVDMQTPKVLFAYRGEGRLDPGTVQDRFGSASG